MGDTSSHDSGADPLVDMLTEFADWARDQEVPSPDEDVVETVLVLLADQHKVTDLGELAKGDLDELLLTTFPAEVSAPTRQDTASVVPAVRALLAFARDTGRLEPDAVARLEREVDQAEPEFADAMMDSSKWGQTKAMLQLMVDDGVDLGDEDEVRRWVEDNEPGLLDDEPTEDAPSGLPEDLPPIRLPDEAELAATARDNELMRRVRRLAVCAADRQAAVEDGDLTSADTVAVARELGMAVSGEVTLMTDVPDLVPLWEFAVGAEFLDILDDHAEADAEDDAPYTGRVTGGDALRRWPDGDDQQVLETWSLVMSLVLSSLDIDTAVAERSDIDFHDAGGMVVALFMARASGITVTALRDMMRGVCTVDGESALDSPGWDSWVDEHGDPAELLLDRLVQLGAVELDGDLARLTSLGLWQVREQLLRIGVDIPLLPPIDTMTAAELVAAADGFSEDELAAETEQWLGLRDADGAADELLRVAASGEPGDRIFATSLVSQLGAEAEPRWRAVLDQQELRAYAKMALQGLNGGAETAAPADLELTPEDLAWLLTDVLAATSDDVAGDELDTQLHEAVPAGREQEVFDVMWRLPHPAVHEVLDRLGAEHPDRKIAKAARKAAFRAASR